MSSITMEKKKIKIRKSVRSFYIIALLLLVVIAWFTLYRTAIYENNAVKKSIYEYKNKYYYTYNIDITDNEFITADNIKNQDTYVTDLIASAPCNMTYTYNANSATQVRYSYQIVGKLEAIYKKDGEDQKLFNRTDIIVPLTEDTVDSDKIEINQSFIVNLKDTIDMITAFQSKIGMQINTNYTVMMEVVTIVNFNGEDIVNTYSPDIVFEIGPKVTKVYSNTEDTEKPTVVSKIEVQKAESVSNIQKIIVTCVTLASLGLIIFILFRTTNSNSVKNEYKVELNKILKGCEEKIVEVSQKVETEGQNLVDVREFEEIIKVSEELFKPILFWNNEKEEESWFCVLGTNIIYRFILKR